MPSIRKKENKGGQVFYEIQVCRGRKQSRLTRRWYPPAGWSRKAIERELTKIAAEFERQCDAGEIISRAEQKELDRQRAQEAAKIQTLRQYGEKVFMPTKAVTIAENSRASFQGNLDKWIYPALGDMKMPEITPADISALLLSMQAQGKSCASCTKIYTILKSLFKMAYLTDAISRNPMDRVSRPRPRKDEIRNDDVDSYTVEEIQYILACVDKEKLKWRAMMHLLIDTGVRRGEAAGLQWKDVDFTENTITICGNLCYTPQNGVYLDTPKSGKSRRIDVDPDVMALLQQIRMEQAGAVISPYVFTQTGSAEPMNPQSITRYFKTFGKRYGVPGFHPHRLRHSFASIAIVNGADIASVSEKLGHADKATTLKMYTHADAESMKRASNIFRDAIKKAGQE